MSSRTPEQKQLAAIESIANSLAWLQVVAVVAAGLYICEGLGLCRPILDPPAPAAPAVEPWEGDLPPQGEIGVAGSIGADDVDN